MARFLWTQKQDIGPAPRCGHALAYDANRKRVVLFGGETAGDKVNDTWEWDGENWTQMADIGPAARSETAMVYDSSRKRILLFGGISDRPLGDTWEWDGENWTQVADSGPAPRRGHAMAFDSARNRTVLFGGELAEGLVGDTWEWDGTEWTQQEETGPSMRHRHIMAFDIPRKRTVLFGGLSYNGSALGDTWEWDGTAWKQVADIGPSPCAGAAMVFAGERTVLFGGMAASQLYQNSWEWDGKYWTERQDIGPKPRWLHAMAYNSDNPSIVLFGGATAPQDAAQNDHLFGDTWAHVVVLPPLASFTIDPPFVNRNPQPGFREEVVCVVRRNPPLDTPANFSIIANLPRVLQGGGTIPAGSATGQFTLTFLADPTIPAGTFNIDTTLGGQTLTATLTIR